MKSNNIHIDRLLTMIKPYLPTSNISNIKLQKHIFATIILFTISVIFIIMISNTLTFSAKFNTITINKQINSSTMFHPHIAVLVEFRTTQRIISIVHNVIYHIPSTWPIQIFHGKENEDFIRNSTLAPLITSGKIILTLMSEVYGRDRTNELLTTPKFWQSVRGEKILLFQIDSIMCSNSPHKITDYLQYDYVGAPWDPSWFLLSRTHLVGNGGFSLRSRSKLLALLAILPYDVNMAEDVWFGLNLHRVNASIAPVDVAKTFSVESIYYERPLAVHGFVGNCTFRADIAKICPESMLIMSDAYPLNCKV